MLCAVAECISVLQALLPGMLDMDGRSISIVTSNLRFLMLKASVDRVLCEVRPAGD